MKCEFVCVYVNTPYITETIIHVKTYHLAPEISHSIEDMPADELLNAHDGVCGCIECPGH